MNGGLQGWLARRWSRGVLSDLGEGESERGEREKEKDDKEGLLQLVIGRW